MCGILAILSHKQLKNREAEIRAFWEKSESRGKDSMGFYAYNLSDKPIITIKEQPIFSQLFKDSIYPTEFYSRRKGSFVLDSVECMLGHTRAATNGNATEQKNNHPFESEHFVWAHNGVMHKHSELKKKYNLTYDSECDSAVIGHMVQKFYNENGFDAFEAVKKAAEELSDAGNLAVWILHKESKRLWLFRNNNPTYYMVLGDTFLMNSESGIMFQAFKDIKNSSDIKSTDADKVYELIATETSFRLEVVAELPKVQSRSIYITKHGQTNGKGTANTGSSEKQENSQQQKKSLSQSNSVATSKAPKVLRERALEIADKNGLDGYFCRRSNELWVFCTSDVKFIEAIEGSRFKPFLKDIDATEKGNRVVMLQLNEGEMPTFLDEVEAFFRPKVVSEGQKLVETYLSQLPGIEFARETEKRYHFRVNNEETALTLSDIGVHLNDFKEFSVKKGRKGGAINTLSKHRAHIAELLNNPNKK